MKQVFFYLMLMLSFSVNAQNKSKRATIAYASIQLDKNEMRLNQVDQVALSDAQQTFVYPDSMYVTMYKNRDLDLEDYEDEKHGLQNEGDGTTKHAAGYCSSIPNKLRKA